MRSLEVITWLLFLSPGRGALAAEKPDARHFELKANSPKFWQLFDHHATLNVVATGFGFTEGPVWDPAGFLYVSDEEQNKIFRVYPSGRKEVLIELGDPDGNTFDRSGSLLDCASVLRAVIQVTPEGKYKILADKFEGKKFNSPNDVVVGPDGALYFTDPTSDLPKGQRQEIPFQGVYRLDQRGQVRLLIRDMKQPNGLAFSPDGKVLYVDDSEKKNVLAFDVSKGGKVSNGRIFASEDEPDGVPDGMRVDGNGNLYVTGPKGIWIWDPHGVLLGRIIVPENPANLAWGESGFSTLFLTAGKSVYRISTETHGFMPDLKRTAGKKTH